MSSGDLQDALPALPISASAYYHLTMPSRVTTLLIATPYYSSHSHEYAGDVQGCSSETVTLLVHMCRTSLAS